MMCVGTISSEEVRSWESTFQCRAQHYVCWDIMEFINNIFGKKVSMPHAALCVLGQRMMRSPRRSNGCFNAACGIMCVGTSMKEAFELLDRFQCRTQHDVCWDTVVPSPCPTRAAKTFWKVIRFSRCFCRQNAFSGRKSAWQIVSIPCAARVAPFWKDAAEECGLRVPMDHFPFYFDH